jgi:hypothetical protein
MIDPRNSFNLQNISLDNFIDLLRLAALKDIRFAHFSAFACEASDLRFKNSRKKKTPAAAVSHADAKRSVALLPNN